MPITFRLESPQACLRNPLQKVLALAVGAVREMIDAKPQIVERLFLGCVLSTIFGVGCNMEKSPNASANLIGTWVAPADPNGYYEGEDGPTRMRMKLAANGEVEMTVIHLEGPGGAGEVTINGKYSTDGRRLASEVFNKGEPVQIELQNDRLILRFEDETYEYARAP